MFTQCLRVSANNAVADFNAITISITITLADLLLDADTLADTVAVAFGLPSSGHI